eukprot:gnl/TRDRNA2_/TRDRNA2_152794_c0_seq2.p1 gnl/TRDRNA2_/TRDRNA2_152794_c0~~gnl/TRDRNA2_/TRDRNA2_152794_c0_seq2.p1  ORF type:complete len:151 (+),score=6.88 gnl/TRDRNA2_/TRDRNA2_152794_c0_seq2:67-453(+)
MDALRPSAADFPRLAGEESLGRFDLVLGCNILCRLAEPRIWLESLPALLTPSAAVVLVTPYAWLDAWTDRRKWLGGRQGTRTSSEEVADIMRRLGFTELAREEIPFLLAQNDRIHELFVSELTAWRLC